MCDVDLFQRLHFAESDFLTALESNTKSLAAYHRTWSMLAETLSSRAPLENGTTSHETFSYVHFVASRISNIAKCYLDVKLGEESFVSQLHNDCDNILSRQASTPHETSPSPLPCAAYRWLLDNLHDPYPTTEVKTRIAAASSCRVSSVNSWFINARRRIGWTTLCREHFANRKANMTDAAYRALVEEDPRRILSSELRHSFIAMKVAAEALYPAAFARSAFVVEDLMDGHERSVGVEKCNQVEQGNAGKMIRHSCTSANGFIATSVSALDNSPADKSEDEDVVPPVVVGSKRCRTSIEPENQLPPAARRCVKRFRASKTSQTPLPSLPPGTDGNGSPSDVCSPRLSPRHSTRFKTSQAPPLWKRHAPDPDNFSIPERTVGLTDAPHLSSEPSLFPGVGSEFTEDWSSQNFDVLFAMPPPVDASEPDISAPWEVELFKDYCIPENLTYASKFPSPVADTSVPAMSRLVELDSLLRSTASNNYVAPMESIPPHAAVPDPPIPDISHTDWTSLLDSWEAYPPTSDPIFSQFLVSQPPRAINLPMLRSLPLTNTTQSHSDIASKRARLGQLHAMQEAVRRMEQELQLEGVILQD